MRKETKEFKTRMRKLGSKGPIFERPKNQNAETLADFVEFCRMHPEYRFWQALRNWSMPGVNFVYVSQEPL